MLAVFSRIFVADTKINFGYSLRAPVKVMPEKFSSACAVLVDRFSVDEEYFNASLVTELTT